MSPRSAKKISAADPAVLVLASLAGGEKHGYAIAADVLDMAGVKLGAATLYEGLARLAAQGLVQELPRDGRRFPYRLTEQGAQALQRHLATLDAVVAEGSARLRAAGRAS